jgi:hypothetical protein
MKKAILFLVVGAILFIAGIYGVDYVDSEKYLDHDVSINILIATIIGLLTGFGLLFIGMDTLWPEKVGIYIPKWRWREQKN